MRKYPEPIIDVAHVQRRSALVMPHDAVAVEHNIARIPAAVVAEYAHQDRRAEAPKRGQHGRKRNIEIAVAIEDEERVAPSALFFPPISNSTFAPVTHWALVATFLSSVPHRI